MSIVSQRQQQLLQEMAIDNWQLSHPERLQGYQAADINLEPSCQLLLVAESVPQGQDALLFSKVLASMKLELKQALHLMPSQLSQLKSHQLQWVWFAGCETDDTFSELKLLQSPALADIHGNNQHRRQLWQQICSYDKQ